MSMIRSHAKILRGRRGTGLVLLLCMAPGLLLAVWDFTPRVSGQGQQPSENLTNEIAPVVEYLSPGDQHKVLVLDQRLAREVQAQGGRLIAEYDSYQILEVNSAEAQKLSQSRMAQIRDEDNLVMLNAGAIDTTKSEVQSQRKAVGSFTGKRLHLVQFAGPLKPEWYDALTSTGVRIVTYIPHNTYLVYGSMGSIQRVQALAQNSNIVQWDGEYKDHYRIDPRIKIINKDAISQERPVEKNKTAEDETDLFAVQLIKDQEENTNTLQLIDRVKLKPITNRWEVLNYVDLVVSIPRRALYDQLAKRPDVVSIAPYVLPQKADERQNLIISGQLTGNGPTPGDYLSYLSGKGFSLSPANFAVNISDSGVDNGTTSPNHFGLYAFGIMPGTSRIIYNRLEGSPNSGSTLKGCDGHGTLNTHIIGGYVPSGLVAGGFPHADASGFRYGLGVAPFVKVGSSVIFDPNSYTNPNLVNLEAKAYRDGAVISSNSWSANTSGTYNVDAQTFDSIVRDAQPSGAVVAAPGNQEYVVVFAAGNKGPGVQTVGSPGTAKNVITAGASENVQAFGGSDSCAIADTGADSANDVIYFSGRGPCADGRKKPDLLAPGTHVSGGVIQVANPPANGQADLCFNGNGVCGGVNNKYFPAGQQWYTSSSGTSHSTPAIAGACALVRQHFINQGLAPPSPAMTKAVLINSARYMTGVGAGDSLWSDNQGMGMVNLNSFFDVFNTPSILRDQVATDTFNASGQQRIITGHISDPSKPFRVTLAYTDAPGPTSGAAYVNNLDLEVAVGGNTYKGNVFSGAFSATGGVADYRNNVESIFIPAGVTGYFAVTVRGMNIAGNGVPNSGTATDQDYALVIYNGTQALLPAISAETAAVTAESGSPSNGAIEPDETVTVSLSLKNVGAANTNNLVATLLPAGGVASPSGPQSYGVLIAGGSAVARNFTFTANAACGSTLSATLQLQDGATNLGTVTYTFNIGALGPSVTGTYGTGSIATAIPDVSTVEIPLTVPDGGSLSDVNVRVRLNHTFDGDLILDLVHPDGTTVNLSRNRGGSGRNFGNGPNDCSGTFTVFDDSALTAISAGSAPFAGTFKPEAALSALNGKPSNGTWKLRITDTAAQDAGTVGCVQLEIARRPYTCPGQACTLNAPADIITNHDPGQCGAVVNYPAPTFSGFCGVVTSSPASGSFFPTGTTTVTITGTKSGGSTVTSTFNVTVNDAQAPVITCPSNISAATGTNSVTAVVNYDVTAMDNCPGLTVVSNPASGSAFHAGTTTVTSTATDASGKTATCTFNVTVKSPLVISEFRFRGPDPDGAGPSTPEKNEFVEIQNITDAPFTINGANGGYALVAADGVVRFLIPNGTVIPARGHFLGVNSGGYGLGGYPAGNGTTATGDASYTLDIPDNSGLALYSTANAQNFTQAYLLDAVGFAQTAAPYFEGTPLVWIAPANAEHSFMRRLFGINGGEALADTNNNATDFVFISTDAGAYGRSGTTFGAADGPSVLGSPAPENLFSTRVSSRITPSLIDPTSPSASLPNRARLFCGDPAAPPCSAVDPNTSTNGYLGIRRKFTNNTGQPVTRLRFRIVDLTTLNSPLETPPQADLRAVSSTDVTVDTAFGPIAVRGTTLETPPSQAAGGGINSSLSAGTITLQNKLSSGAEINVQFLLGVKSLGWFRFFIIIEALP